MPNLSGKIALVTSGTRGIGLQCVNKLATNGATVYIGARRLESANKICNELMANGYQVKSVYFDATKIETYESMISEILSSEGRLDILVNNYGGTNSKTDLDLVNGSTETFFETLNRNISSVYLPCKFAIPQMIKQNGGSIINISSIGSILPDVSRLGYSVSKAAINSLTQNIAVQYANHGIRCNAILPGLIATDAALQNMSNDFIETFLKHVPLHRFGQPNDIANAVLFLASDDSSFITGEFLEVAGGFGIPSPMYGEDVLL